MNSPSMWNTGAAEEQASAATWGRRATARPSLAQVKS